MSLALNQVKNALAQRLVPHIDVSDLAQSKASDPEASERFTRSLAAAALLNFTEIDDRQAAHCVTDGSNDGGVDAVYIDAAHSALVLVQSKWSADGKGSIAHGDLLKFFEGFKRMMEFDWNDFNKRIQGRKKSIEQVLSDPQVQVKLCIVTSSDTALSAVAKKQIVKFLAEVNTPGLEMVDVEHMGLSQVHSVMSGRRTIDLEGTLENWGPISEPYIAQYGVMNASDLSEWYTHHGERLFEANIRQPLGRTPANESIYRTLIGSPTEFWYLNNGVTVLAERIKKSAKGGASRTQGSFRLESASIVNGAQTVSTIHAARSAYPDEVDKAKVSIRFISLEDGPEDLAERITRATNTQNAVESRDFVSLETTQARLREEMLLQMGKTYSIRRGETAPAAEHGCSVVDATVALACRKGPAMAVVAKSTIGRIWDSVGRSPYNDLFNVDTTAVDVWRSVEVTRAVDRTLDDMRPNLYGRPAAFAVQGNRLVLTLVFAVLPSDLQSIPQHSWDELLAKVPRATERAFERLTNMLDEHFSENYLAALIKNSSRSTELFELARRKMRRVT